MGESDRPGDIESYIDQVLPDIDSILAIDGTPISSRPLLAIDQFLEICVVAISDGGQLDPKSLSFAEKIESRWYATLLYYITKWYRTAYPNSKHDRATLTGAAFLLGGYFEIQVPYSIERNNGDLTDIWFLRSVWPEEDPMEWLVAPPNFSMFDEDGCVVASVRIAYLAELLRKFFLNMNFARSEDAETQGMISLVLPSFERGVQKILTSSTHVGLKSAIAWDFHFAIELSLKALINLQGKRFPPTHELRKLTDFLNLDRALVRKILRLPTARQVIDARYGECVFEPIANAYAFQLEILEILAPISNKLMDSSKGIRAVEDFRITLREPPWSEHMREFPAL